MNSATPIQVINVRRIEAPVERVFVAFANPRELEQWWGPNGFTNRVPQFDFRPGGSWQVIMRAPDGKEYDNLSRFLLVTPPHRIVYEHLQPMHRFQMTMDYRELGGGATELRWTMDLQRNTENEKLRDFLQQANEQNFDRLCAFLAGDSRAQAPRTAV